MQRTPDQLSKMLTQWVDRLHLMLGSCVYTRESVKFLIAVYHCIRETAFFV